jgi:hypothetical protein
MSNINITVEWSDDGKFVTMLSSDWVELVSKLEKSSTVNNTYPNRTASGTPLDPSVAAAYWAIREEDNKRYFNRKTS